MFRPRRSAVGLDGNRLSMLMAVLGRRHRIPVGDHDVYASTVGGVKLTEPGVDLARPQPAPTSRRNNTAQPPTARNVPAIPKGPGRAP